MRLQTLDLSGLLNEITCVVLLHSVINECFSLVTGLLVKVGPDVCSESTLQTSIHHPCLNLNYLLYLN